MFDREPCRYGATVNQSARKALGMILGFVTFTILFLKSSGRVESWLWYVVAAVATVGSFYFWTTGSGDR
jgi:hypothetical protein